MLTARGVPGLFVDARTWNVTDDHFGDALVDWPATQDRIEERSNAWQGRVPVNTGFLGQTPDGRTTTLRAQRFDHRHALAGREGDDQYVDRVIGKCRDVGNAADAVESVDARLDDQQALLR